MAAIMVGLALLLQGCKIDTLIGGTVVNGNPNPNSTLAWSEQSTFTPDGRYFVIGGNKPFTYGASVYPTVNGVSSVYEVKKNAAGKHTNVSILDGSVGGNTCYFSSLTSVRFTLYAICTDLLQLMPESVMYRIDLTKPASDPNRIVSAPLTTPGFEPNGMTADQNGDLYIPNSVSYLATYVYGLQNVPAIVKVHVTDPVSFKISETGWLPAAFGGFSPNGVAISGNQLYMPSLNVIYRIPILQGGGAGAPTVIYQTANTNMFDNVTVVGNMIAVPEITNPSPVTLQLAYPGTPPATTLTSQITLIDIVSGKKLGAAAFPSYARPSSVILTQGDLFPPASALVTDAIGSGGLYLLQQ
jgi:hypothetical protein